MSLLTLTLSHAWLRGQPMAMDDATVTTLPCVSYAPFHRPQSTPLAPDGAASADQVEEDLVRLKPLTNCVRTYGVAQGLDAVPRFARKLGMRVRQGVWLGRDDAANRVEIERAIALAQDYRDVIDVLIVGNEVLLRRDLSVEQLSGYLREVKSRTDIAVTYADVWEFWQRHALLRNEVDWVTVHILPYWEDVPVSAMEAADHVFKTAHDMQMAFTGKPVWVGETGWPATGRQRAGARPGVFEQTLLIRQLASRAAKERVAINIIEAFDQPWKRALEGAMGGAWGLFTADGARRVSLNGDVIKDINWQPVFVGAGVGFLLGLIVLWLNGLIVDQSRPKGFLIASSLTAASMGAALIGVAVALHMAFIVLWSRTSSESTIASAIAAIVLAATIVMLYVIAGESAETDERSMRVPRAFAWAQITLLFVAASWALILAADPRYRGFPVALFSVPAALSGCFVLLKERVDSHGYLHHESLFLSWSLVLVTAVMVTQEGVANTEALALAGCWVLLAAPSIVDAMMRSGERQSREQ